METLAHHPFHIMVENTSKMSTRFLKNVKVRTLGEAPSKIVPVPKELPLECVNEMPIYKGKLNKEQQFDQRQQVTKTDKESQEKHCKNQLHVNQSYGEH